MGWKGTIRSVSAAIRAAEREAVRRQKELERQRKANEKMLEQERAAYEVELYENYIDRLTSFHKESVDKINWTRLSQESPPSKPIRINQEEQNALAQLSDFKPGMLGNVLNLAEKKRKRLEENVRIAKQKDESTFQHEVIHYNRAYKDWKDSVDFANQVLAGNKTCYGQAIEELNAFEELSEIGSQVSIEINHPSAVEAFILVNGEKVIPSEQKTLLKSGKLSSKKMPVGKYNELYQDAVCSAILKVARDLCAMLPVNGVIVTAYDNMLNSGTGHLEKQPIVSVAMPKKTLETLNMGLVDPSDSMKNFVHKMDFKKTKGFAPVKRILLSDLKSAKAEPSS